ncbi:MAG: galactokinase [Acidobacteria bacterium]|nr:MAG: galactokinase [Acidobacteriota bacterium]RPJ77182.1 MAG: galactokinase [Acidobacteriota bacterium]
MGQDRVVEGAPAFWVPGRVEVLGKHTDYAGGRSLICATDHGFAAAAAPRADARVQVLDVARDGRVWLALDPALPDPAESWARYPATVLRRVARNFPEARRGADVAFLSNLPAASGMSSSSAFMVAVFLAIAAVNRLRDAEQYRREIRTPEDLAGYLGTVENGQSFGSLTGDRGVGTFGGSEDHTAMLCGRAGELSLYSFCPVRHEGQVPFPAGHVLVVAVSGVVAEKTGAARDAYNHASLAAGAVLRAWRQASGRGHASLAQAVAESGVTALREAVRETVVDGFSTARLLDRLEQFHAESFEIVPAAAAALEAGRLDDFGALVARSQDLAERCLGNQVAETIALARLAREHGAIAASAFGAGFGGSVWALVPEAEAPAFKARWASAYRTRFPRAASGAVFLTTRPGVAAHGLGGAEMDWP